MKRVKVEVEFNLPDMCDNWSEGEINELVDEAFLSMPSLYHLSLEGQALQKSLSVNNPDSKVAWENIKNYHNFWADRLQFTDIDTHNNIQTKFKITILK